MASQTECPACMSTRVTAAPREEWEQKGAFQVVPSRKCLDCGTIWEPEAARGWLLLGIGVGLLLLALGAFATWSGRVLAGVTFMAMGFGAAAGCLRRWRAKDCA